MRSEGARLLGAVDLRQAEIARRVGVRQPTVAGWVSGQHVPKPKYRKALKLAFGIPFAAWPADIELEELREAAQRLAEEVEAMRAEMKFVAQAIVEEVKGDPDLLVRIADRFSATLRR